MVSNINFEAENQLSHWNNQKQIGEFVLKFHLVISMTNVANLYVIFFRSSEYGSLGLDFSIFRSFYFHN